MEKSEFEVEKVICYRLNNGRLEYLLKWKGYPEAYNSWEPSENINPELLRQLPEPKVEETGSYEVERILNKRKRNGVIEYCIKWKGYPESENSWEPIENIDQELITEYETQNHFIPTRPLSSELLTPPAYDDIYIIENRLYENKMESDKTWGSVLDLTLKLGIQNLPNRPLLSENLTPPAENEICIIKEELYNNNVDSSHCKKQLSGKLCDPVENAGGGLLDLTVKVNTQKPMNLVLTKNAVISADNEIGIIIEEVYGNVKMDSSQFIKQSPPITHSSPDLIIDVEFQNRKRKGNNTPYFPQSSKSPPDSSHSFKKQASTVITFQGPYQSIKSSDVVARLSDSQYSVIRKAPSLLETMLTIPAPNKSESANSVPLNIPQKADDKTECFDAKTALLEKICRSTHKAAPHVSPVKSNVFKSNCNSCRGCLRGKACENCPNCTGPKIRGKKLKCLYQECDKVWEKEVMEVEEILQGKAATKSDVDYLLNWKEHEDFSWAEKTSPMKRGQESTRPTKRLRPASLKLLQDFKVNIWEEDVEACQKYVRQLGPINEKDKQTIINLFLKGERLKDISSQVNHTVKKVRQTIRKFLQL